MNSLTEMTAIKTGHALSMKNSSIPLVEIEFQENPPRIYRRYLSVDNSGTPN